MKNLRKHNNTLKMKFLRNFITNESFFELFRLFLLKYFHKRNLKYLIVNKKNILIILGNFREIIH